MQLYCTRIPLTVDLAAEYKESRFASICAMLIDNKRMVESQDNMFLFQRKGIMTTEDSCDSQMTFRDAGVTSASMHGSDAPFRGQRGETLSTTNEAN